MAFKIATLLALATFVLAKPQDYKGYNASPAYHQQYIHAPTVIKTAAPVYKKIVEHELPAEYEFHYAVHDDHTKDIKSQSESRKGDMVKGHYDMIDSDGFKRIVEYTADKHNGFQAVVHREKTDIVVPMPEPKHHKIISAAPVQHHYVHQAPDVHKPITQITYASPKPVAHKYVGHVANHYTKINYAAPVAKVVTPGIQYAEPKYVAPVVHKAVVPNVPVTHYKPQSHNSYTASGHDGSHVSFHGSDTSYQY